MAYLEFSVPYNGSIETLDEVLALGAESSNIIREVYLNAPQEIMGSGRTGPAVSHEGFIATLSRIHEAGVRADITMNSTCDGSEWYSSESVERQIGFIQRMHEDHGVEAVTLANPFLIEKTRKACPGLEISASVLADIDCYVRARTFAQAGANIITVDTSVNKDLKLLKQIVQDLGVELKLMVNEGCLYKCPYRKFHMNYISHKSKDVDGEGTSFSFACGDVIKADPAQLFISNWIRPEDLRRYEGITSFFKIVGRDMLHSKVVRCCKAYLSESYEGNLLDLLCSSIGFYGIEYSGHIDNKALDATSFFKRTATCNRKCNACTYCGDLARDLLGYGWVTRENLEDVGEYQMVKMIEAQFKGNFPICPEFSPEPREINDRRALR